MTNSKPSGLACSFSLFFHDLKKNSGMHAEAHAIEVLEKGLQGRSFNLIPSIGKCIWLKHPTFMALRKKGDRMLKEAKLSDRSTIIVDSQNSFTGNSVSY